ncbi:hypothetical protein NBRC3188_1797 [Acetobacter pasteurianus NBRC 3188]|uniref:Uncharacterized protein n=1 Tax=Acetobacter pasteurianus NBRC 3188 TaxID=1226663 RepID=A0A401WV19_ACEPA|nr:hypothetical protein NBRC3188_1797 [Acetobacter pasteurianus NBRC 3188]
MLSVASPGRRRCMPDSRTDGAALGKHGVETPLLVGATVLRGLIFMRDIAEPGGFEKPSAFFDVEERLARLSGLGDQLEAFSRTVDFGSVPP